MSHPQKRNLKKLACWICDSPTLAGVEAVRVICPNCVAAGHATFTHHKTFKPSDAPTTPDRAPGHGDIIIDESAMTPAEIAAWEEATAL